MIFVHRHPSHFFQPFCGEKAESTVSGIPVNLCEGLIVMIENGTRHLLVAICAVKATVAFSGLPVKIADVTRSVITSWYVAVVASSRRPSGITKSLWGRSWSTCATSITSNIMRVFAFGAEMATFATSKQVTNLVSPRHLVKLHENEER